MPQRLLLALVLAFAVLGGTAFWLFSRDDARAAGDRRTPTPPAAESRGGGNGRDAATLHDAPRPPVPAGSSAETRASTERTVAAGGYERELADARWVSGRVHFPPDTPAEERVRVVAKGRDFEHGPDHAVDIQPDGGFRVAFAPKTKNGTLRLEATWLYLDEPVKVAFGKGDPAEVVLEPHLGGLVRGAVIPPKGTDPALLVGSTVTLWGRRLGADDVWNTPIWKTAELGTDLAYEFGGLPADGRFDVECDPEFLVPAGVDDFLVEPGREVRFDLELRAGATIAGRVVDAAGAPIERATVRAEVAGDPSWSDEHHRLLLTDATGAFRLAGVAPGNVELHVEAKGFDGRVEPLGVLAAGDVRENVELVLDRGHSIAGLVTWPDGTPAAGAMVDPELSGTDSPWTRSNSVKADDEGRFEITGLEPGTYRINATAVKRERVMVTSRLTGKERERTVSETLRTAALDVSVGTRDLVLVLSKGLTLAGQVVDDAGAPIARFQLEFGRRIVSGMSTHVMYDGRRIVKDDDGLFELDGLELGGLSLRVSADGYLQGDPVEVELPLAEPLPPIVMTRAAKIAGVVLTPGGSPASGARLEVECAAAFEGVQLGDTRTTRSDGTMSFALAVDDDGTFALDGVPPTALELRATLPGTMPSEPLALELAPGEVRAGLVLRLATGARLTGVVLGADGKPTRRRFVQVEAAQGGFETMVQSDVDGSFEVAGLVPGAYALVAEPSPSELDALGFSALAGAAEALASRAEIDVPAAGAHVVLRPPDAAPVRVFGTVRINAELSAANLTFYGGPTDSVATAHASVDGGYAILLPVPGEYQLSLEPDIEGAARTTSDVDVIGPLVFRHDVELFVGGISGRVFGPSGPAAGIPVRASQQLDEHGEPVDGWAYGTSGPDGGYAFVGLAAGTWTVVAGGPRNRGWGAAVERTRFLTEARADGVRVQPEEMRTGIDLRADAAGAIAGVVRRLDGSPAPSARIYLRDAAGALVDHRAEAQADGKFELAGLAPGDYLLGAAQGDQVTPSEIPITVRAEAESNAALELALGTTIRIHVTDPAGAPREGYVGCTRADGADLSSWFDWDEGDWWDALGEYRFGPLPPGDYVVTADWAGSKKTQKKVALHGEATIDVTLVLP